VRASYGSFGSDNGGFDVAFGGLKWGNFIAANGLNTGRFLDPPEFQVIHSKGNEQNIFDRVDLQFTGADSVHLNGGYTRSWFQNPNSFDALASGQDQRAQIKTYNIAPTWTHLFSTSTLLKRRLFRTARPVQLLPERKSPGGRFRDRHSAAQADQSGPAQRPLLCEGHPQRENGSDL